MKRYRITRNGVSGVTELNPAAVVHYLTNGWTVTYVGPSLVTIVDEGTS